MLRVPSGQESAAHVRRLKTAEVASGLGALVLGVGLGAMFATWLSRVALVLAVIGAVLHAVGMWTKHRLEVMPDARRPLWMTALYWLCWMLLVLGAAYLLVVTYATG